MYVVSTGKVANVKLPKITCEAVPAPAILMFPFDVRGELVIERALPVSVIPTLVRPVFVSAAHGGIPDAAFNTCPVEPIAHLASVVLLEAYSISPVV